MARKQVNPLDQVSERIQSSPVEFATSLLTEVDGTPAKPHDAQIDIMEGLTDPKIKDATILTGRQFGKSHLLAWYICWFMVVFPHSEVWLIAPSLDQARIIFDEVANHFRKFPLSTLLAKKIVEHPFPDLVLKNGSHLNVRGANSPQFIRGHRAHLVVIDEAAFIKDGVSKSAIEPLLTVTGKRPGSKIIRISTPFGKGDFYDSAVGAMSDKSGTKFYRHYTTLDNPHIDTDRVLAVRDEYGENSLIWQTEYMANLFVSDNSVFDWKDIEWACNNYPENTREGSDGYPFPATRGNRYAQGVDLANMDDYFVSTILDTTNQQRLMQVCHDRLQKKGYVYYKQLIRDRYRDYNNAKTMIDATSLGQNVVEDLEDIHPVPFVFTGSQAKYDLVHDLVRLFAQHKIVIPMNRDCINELRFFQYKITSAKNLKMEAKRGYHDDYVMSLAMTAQVGTKYGHTGFFGGVDLSGLSEPKYLDQSHIVDPIFGDYDE